MFPSHVSNVASDFPVVTQLNPFKYHSVESRRLWDVTLQGLEMNGITLDGIGERLDDKFVLRGCLRLSPYALAQLPPHLGGSLADAPIDMPDRTVSFIDAINTASPTGYKGASTRQRLDELSEAIAAEMSDLRAPAHEASDFDAKSAEERPRSDRPKRDTKKSGGSVEPSAERPPTTPLKFGRGLTSSAPPTIRSFIDEARQQRVRIDPVSVPLDPKADQVHAFANASTLRLATEARQIIARSASRIPCVIAALLTKAGASDLQKPNLNDFSPTAVIEAARAVQNQEAILSALLASAVAEGAAHGQSAKEAIEALSDTFDQCGKDAINRGQVTCVLSTLDLALGVYPIGQLALALCTTRPHSPAVLTSSSLPRSSTPCTTASSTRTSLSRLGTPSTTRRSP